MKKFAGIDGQLSAMRNSTLRKWANNKNQKNKNGNKNWIHPPEALQGGHIVYLVKFLGNMEVTESKGIEVVKETITKLRFNQQIKKTEGSKIPKVELTVSVDGVAIQRPKSNEILWQYPLHQISYCADDKAEKRFLSFIAKEADREAHTCFVFVSDKLAEDITLTIGQAFDLAYRRFLETSNREAELRRQLSSLRLQLQAAQEEKMNLRERLKKVSELKDRQDLSRYMEENGVEDLLSVGDEPPQQPAPTQPGIPDVDDNNHLPSLPPRNNTISTSRHILEEQETTSEDDFFDFDPRAHERSSTGSQPPPTNGRSPNESHEFSTDDDDDDDDDFDPRAGENGRGGETPRHPPVIDIKPSSKPLDLNGISNFPPLVPPPPRSSRPDKTNAISFTDQTDQSPFSSQSQFDQMKAGFTRGLSFGSADTDFTLESLDPLKN